jgi:hypothetical protein
VHRELEANIKTLRRQALALGEEPTVGATHCDKNFSTLSTERLDRAQWRHTIRIVHRHYRAFQRGRRGTTLRKGRSMMG